MNASYWRGRQADVFCTVVDNYGDAGVCWRLSRRFAALGLRVRLIIDRPELLDWMAPAALRPDGVEIVPWAEVERTPEERIRPADLVVETFGCRIPERYERALAREREAALSRGERPSFYFNLDYLSAEDWVESSHGIWGLHPTLPIRKLWFFPGFTDRTGGVVVESEYEEEAKSFRARRAEALEALGADPARRTLYYFAYPENPAEALAEALRRVEQPMNVLAAPGAGGDALERSLSGSLHRVVRTGYRPQSEFDRLLWASDAAVVRGEDSFVRAQLAGIPFLWSIYPTEDGAHFVKLDAWLGRLEPFFAEKARAERYEALARGWVKGEPDLGALTDFLEGIEDRAAFEAWGASIRRRGDLAVRMLERAELGE